MKFPIPENEDGRLQALLDLQILDSLPSPVFDNITELAASICGAEIALVSLVDAERLWFKARRGVELSESGRDEAFCAHTIMDTANVMVINDATQDPRFADFPLVRGGNVRFYAGAPITTQSGHALGAVCVLGQEKMSLSAAQARQLQHLANLTMGLIETEALRRREARMILDLVRKNERIIRNVLDEGREMAAFIDPQHRYLYVNPAFERYWTQSQDALLGLHVRELVGKRLYREVCQVGINQALSGHESMLTFEYSYPGMGLRRVELFHIPALDDKGRVHGVVERHRDVTELTRQTEQLRHYAAELETRRAMQDQYLHSISHDLKQPVNSINNAAPVLASGLKGKLPALEQRCLSYIERGGRRLARLLEDMRIFGELEGRAPQIRRHDARALVDECLGNLHDEIEQCVAVVDVQVVGDLWVEAAVFEMALRCVLEHLFWTSTKTPTRIAIRLVHEGGFSRLQMIDTSSQNTFPIIDFGGVFQSTPDQTKARLPIARQIAMTHGGTLIEETTAEGCRNFVLAIPKETNSAR